MGLRDSCKLLMVATVSAALAVSSPAVATPVTATAGAPVVTDGRTNDALFDQQWGLSRLRAPGAWTHATGDGVRVAVISTGVDASHPDLASRVTEGATFLNDADAVTPRPGNTDEAGNGTHTAGVIAAKAGDGFGIAGVSPNATIIPIRVVPADRAATRGIDVARGIDFAIAEGADVIHLDVPGLAFAPAPTHISLANAATADIIVIGGPNRLGTLPTAGLGDLGIAPIDRAGFVQTAEDAVRVAVPGVDIVSTLPGGEHGSAPADSDAALALMGGVAALAVEASDFTLSRAGWVDALTTSLADHPAVCDTCDPEKATEGRVDAAALVCHIAGCEAGQLAGDALEIEAEANGLYLVPSFAKRSNTVKHGTAVRLQVNAGKHFSWNAYPGATVPVKIKKVGQPERRLTVKANANGRAIVPVVVDRRTTVTVGSTTTSSLTLHATPVVSVKASGKRATVSVKTLGRSVVQIQKRTARGWTTQKRVTVGGARASVKGLSKGQWRAVVARTSTHNLGVSRTWRVR